MKLRDEHKKMIVVMLFGILSAGIFATGSFVQQQRNTSNTNASSICNCTDSNVCYPDGCSRKPKTSNNQYEESRYDSVCKQFDLGYRVPDSILIPFCSQRQPDCCFDVYKYKESRLCCWQERYSCHPSLCEGSSGGAGCGQYWSLYKGGAYGCVVPGANGEAVPAWGLPPGLPGTSQPTNTPQPIIPTNTPATQQPTNTPMPTSTVPPNQPTSTPAPTNSPIPTNQQPTNAANIQPSYNPQPTNPPLPTNTPYIFPTIEIKSPKELAREFINPESIQKLERNTEKVFNAPKEGLNTIKEADQKLERTAYSWIVRVRIFIENLIN